MAGPSLSEGGGPRLAENRVTDTYCTAQDELALLAISTHTWTHWDKDKTSTAFDSTSLGPELIALRFGTSFRKDVSTSPRRWLFGRGPQGIAAGDPPWYAGADRDRCRPPHSSSPASANPNKPRCRQPCVWGFKRVLFFREMLLCWNASNQLKLNNLPWVNLQWRENLNVRRERGLPPPLF